MNVRYPSHSSTSPYSLAALLVVAALALAACSEGELLAPPFRLEDAGDSAIEDSRGRDLAIDVAPDLSADGTPDARPDVRVDLANDAVPDPGRSDVPGEISPDFGDDEPDATVEDEPDVGPVCTPLDDCMDETASDVETESCGDCGGGMRSRTRRCDVEACTWGEWGEWGACACATPTETDSRGCGNCNAGSQSRSRTCQASSCTWSAWSDFGACSGGGACSPGQRRASGSCDPCEEEVCSSSCTWNGSCALRGGAACRWESGTNWRCCGGSRWQFCLPGSCQWSTDCATCSGCGC
jgi:hypothetical protein